MMNKTYQDIQYIYRMSRTNDRTGIRIAVQYLDRRDLFLFLKMKKTIDIMTGQCNHDKIEK